MKIGFRTPSLTKRLAARTSWKRMVRHRLGLKAPRGWGWVTNPRRAAYNRIYYRTTIDPIKLLTGGGRRRRRRKSGGAGLLVLLIIAALVWLFSKSTTLRSDSASSAPAAGTHSAAVTSSSSPRPAR